LRTISRDEKGLLLQLRDDTAGAPAFAGEKPSVIFIMREELDHAAAAPK
jgi:hypothetical protein